MPNGKIILISPDYFLDLCYSYSNTGVITYSAGCTKTNIGAYALYDYKADVGELLILNHNKQLKLFNSVDNSTNPFALNPQPSEIFSVAYNNGFLSVLENKGTKISLYIEGGGKFSFSNSKEDFSFVTEKGISYKSTQLLGIAISGSGMIYAVSPSDDSVYSFDNELRIKDVYEFLPGIRPYKKIQRPLKIIISKKDEYV
ncbi:hypothetical protein LEP1GSC163_2765 [Leptospira santarosai str. CBC379]|nr:hypothetical protein [Leptospira santarosai]EKR89658.1 hypothetical protein LEP1GSC163_2765 [Leptospira santarosai str. CBC379]